MQLPKFLSYKLSFVLVKIRPYIRPKVSKAKAATQHRRVQNASRLTNLASSTNPQIATVNYGWFNLESQTSNLKKKSWRMYTSKKRNLNKLGNISLEEKKGCSVGKEIHIFHQSHFLKLNHRHSRFNAHERHNII